ncbi:MAG: hypothetical protein IPL19_03035 [Sandaracinaceae bacterium]|nr:hypothetical protein [Sandaracinaceae bacterium]
MVRYVPDCVLRISNFRCNFSELKISPLTHPAWNGHSSFMSEQSYNLSELSSLLKFSSAYLKMLLKKQAGYQPDQPISAELAAAVAAQVNRPWPPTAVG